MISERLREGRTEGTDLRWHVTDVHREAADVIDALVAALERLRSLNESGGDPFGEPGRPTLQMVDKALAMARRK